MQLAVLLVLVCLLLSVLYRFRWAGLFLLGLWIPILAGAFLLAREELEQGARFLYTRLTTIYHTAYRSVQLPAWRPRTSGNVTLLLALWGGALACVNAWVIRRRQSVAPALLLDALPLALCLVVVDTPPDLWCLALPPRRRLSAAPDPVQPDSQPPGRQPADSGAGPAGDGAPAGALPADSSRDLHKGPDRRGNPASHPGLGRGHAPLELDSHGRLRLAVSVAGNTTADVDLRMGPRLPSHRTIMEVLAEETGSLYLRALPLALTPASAGTGCRRKPSPVARSRKQGCWSNPTL
ncbi:MAG: hypothetical protein ACLSHU_02160 [Oscillospiraceae bacterium]